MKKICIAIIIFSALNCAKTDYYLRNVDAKVRMTGFTLDEGYVLKRRFELSHTRVNLFWGLANVYKKDLELILNPELRNYEKEAIGNLTITEKYDFLDSLVDWILIGIVRPYTVVLEGSVYEKSSELNQERPIENDQEKVNKKGNEGTNVKKK